MSNPFELSQFVDQHRRRLQAQKANMDNPREAFEGWVQTNQELVENIVSALSGPDQPNFFLAMHEPGNPLPRRFMEVLCAQPALNFFEGTTQSIPGDSVLDALFSKNPVEALTERWEQSPNASRFALNVLAALVKVSTQPTTADEVRATLTDFASVFPESLPEKCFRDGKAIRILAARIKGQREPLDFSNSRLGETVMIAQDMSQMSYQCDILSGEIEDRLNIKSKWATHTLRAMNVWEPSSTEATGMQVRVSHDNAKTRDNFDITRKIIHPHWAAPAHIEEKVSEWVKQSQSYDVLARRLDARRPQEASSDTPRSPHF